MIDKNKVFKEIDFRGKTFSCSTRRWNNHFVSGRPILACNEEAMKSTIDNPDCIYTSTDKGKNIYFKQSSLPTVNPSPYGNCYSRT